ncbi:MAG: hypothetical protein QOH53_2260 [Ilumatobacteraceae bacterium]|jgi:hypothetical protein
MRSGRVSPFEKDGKVRVPGVARCIVETKQDANGTRQHGAQSPTKSTQTRAKSSKR